MPRAQRWYARTASTSKPALTATGLAHARGTGRTLGRALRSPALDSRSAPYDRRPDRPPTSRQHDFPMSIVLWTRLEAVERTLAQLTPCVADLEALVQRVTTLEGQLAALSGNVPITSCESRVEEVSRETRSGINDPNSRIENLGLPLSNAEAVTNLTRNAVQDQAVEGSQNRCCTECFPDLECSARFPGRASKGSNCHNHARCARHLRRRRASKARCNRARSAEHSAQTRDTATHAGYPKRNAGKGAGAGRT